MEIERFKSNLSKSEIKNMAIDTVRKYLDSTSALDVLSFAKKLILFSDTLVKEAETEAKMVWDQEKGNYPNMNYTQGGTIYDFDKDPVYKSIKKMLADRTELLKTALKIDSDVVDGDGVIVPKVPIKGYRKDSINVKI